MKQRAEFVDDFSDDAPELGAFYLWLVGIGQCRHHRASNDVEVPA